MKTDRECIFLVKMEICSYCEVMRGNPDRLGWSSAKTEKTSQNQKNQCRRFILPHRHPMKVQLKTPPEGGGGPFNSSFTPTKCPSSPLFSESTFLDAVVVPSVAIQLLSPQSTAALCLLFSLVLLPSPLIGWPKNLHLSEE